MNMRDCLMEVFLYEVKSYDDFKNRIKIIEEEFSKKQNRKGKKDDFKFYYRGDRYCMSTQSNLFRKKLIPIEDELFDEWQKDCESKRLGTCKETKCGSLMCLAHMQHYLGNTRLLDFTTDPLVALRFACGKEGENCCKKVTVYFTEQIDLTESNTDNAEKEHMMMSLVKSKQPPKDRKKILFKDWFIKVPQNFPLIERQKGLFLFMGNHCYINDEDTFIKEKKVAHQLSETIGRGISYRGYVGVLKIASSAIESIRNELEKTNEYNIDYLLYKK